MADFCLDCVEDLFGKGLPSDFEGILTEKEKEEGYTISVLCEGCGYIEVDHLGKKVDKEC